MPARKSLTGARVPASVEFVGTFARPEVSRLVYLYSIRPRIVFVITYSIPAPTVQPLNLPQRSNQICGHIRLAIGTSAL